MIVLHGHYVLRNHRNMSSTRPTTENKVSEIIDLHQIHVVGSLDGYKFLIDYHS